ncbi:hypothetical protein [Chthonobacter rhizosphaerae]|uniref:hypothetical protein n=1 Tax=Chthonobacter rhizosphaerae TaxID=2735553 RepID=UPI0015EFCD40
MTTAWEISRKAKAIYGGNVREYLSLALKDAWKQCDPYRTSLKATHELIAELRARNVNLASHGPRSMQGAAHWIGR